LDDLKEALKRAENIDLSPLIDAGFECEKTPTGFIIKNLSEDEYINIALNMLENYGIITITAAGMPGASKTLRIDFCSNDAKRISNEYIINAIINSKNN
jgi:L-seryl-tRNA(Ser) seleniumtransferase